MSLDPHAFLQTLLAKEAAEAYRQEHLKSRPPLVITLSRDFAAGGEAIARQLGTCLGIPIYNSEILDLVGKKTKVEAFRLKAYDEDASAHLSNFIYGVLTGSANELVIYRRALYEAVAELAEKDCLLVGRGAHLILAGKKVFRIRIVGSKLVCAQRIVAETGISLEQAERQVYAVNNKRHKSIEQLFKDSFEHCYLEFAKNFDLVINTDHLSIDSAVAIILLGLSEAGFPLRTSAGKP
jgi:uncharacterized membrane protein